MKISHFDGFGSKTFSLVADTPDDEVLLRRFVELAPRCSLRACNWQLEPVPRRPMEKVVSRVNLKLADAGTFEARELDVAHARAKKNAA